MNHRVTFQDGECLGRRIEFVKGGGDVKYGDGTPFPLEVTLLELEEIMFRVRDAWFTDGAYTITLGMDVNLTGGPPGEKLIDGGSAVNNPVWARGFYTLEEVPDSFDSLFDDSYEVSHEDDMTGVFAREANSEYLIWAYELVFGGVPPAWQISPIANMWTGFVCGFSHGSHFPGDIDAPSRYCFYNSQDAPSNYYDATVVVNFSGQVAFIGADSPLDPAATLYVGCVFELHSTGALLLNSLKTYETAPLSGVDFVLELAESSVSLPLYYEAGGATGSGTDFVLSAKKWWPYAHPNGSPNWNITDGAFLAST